VHVSLSYLAVLYALSRRLFRTSAAHRLGLEALHHWSNLISRMCGWSRAVIISLRAIHPCLSLPLPLSQKWLLLHPRVLVAFSHPRVNVVTGRDANFLTDLSQLLERVPRRSETHHLPHPDLPGHQEPFATSTGVLVNAAAGLTVHFDIKTTPTRNLAVPTLPVESTMEKAFRTQLWNISRSPT
jgi:hypothetical protein